MCARTFRVLFIGCRVKHSSGSRVKMDRKIWSTCFLSILHTYYVWRIFPRIAHNLFTAHLSQYSTELGSAFHSAVVVGFFLFIAILTFEMAHLNIYVYSLTTACAHPRTYHLLRYIQPHFHVIRSGLWHCWWLFFQEENVDGCIHASLHYLQALGTNHNVLFFGTATVSLSLPSSSSSTLTPIVLRAISLPSMESSWIEQSANTNVWYLYFSLMLTHATPAHPTSRTSHTPTPFAFIVPEFASWQGWNFRMFFAWAQNKKRKIKCWHSFVIHKHNEFSLPRMGLHRQSLT